MTTVALFILLALVAAVAVLLHDARALRAAARRLAEQASLIAHANPSHRLDSRGGGALDAVAAQINAVADERSRLLANSQQAIVEAKARVESERNRFAALLAELEQSVLVCNRDGRILLCNEAARQLLSAAATAQPRSVGLGRSAFGLIDRALVEHALARLDVQVARGDRASLHFVTATASGRQLRIHVAPVPSASPQGSTSIDGMVLLLNDISESVEADARSVALLQSLVEGTRSSLAGMREAIASMAGESGSDSGRRSLFAAVARSEADHLELRLDEFTHDAIERLRVRWPLEDVRGADLLALAGRRIEQTAGIATAIDEADHEVWLRADSFTLIEAVAGLAQRLRDEFAVRDVHLRLQDAATEVHLDLCWRGVPMSSETAFLWQNDAYTLGGESSPVSLAQVLERHHGRAWYQRDTPRQTNCFRLALPRTRAPAPRTAPSKSGERPEFYDFDLFHRSVGSARLDDRPLPELAYTVFDTETTGLDPNGGDEILSIGAVRIVNGRVLRDDTFESLVDAPRSPSVESIRIHGITPEMLAGAPAIEDVLPRFSHFAEETVLVAHNAAFDMRFLQLKESQTGIVFRQPVLDTLLLAAVANPSESSQSLEEVAHRLGVRVQGRHTALGDAMATAEVFLGLIPLLAAQGVHTLGEALVASEKTYYARVKY